jgi:hypothetical protein
MRRDLLEGLDLSWFSKSSIARRSSDGSSAEPLLEAFFQDAVRSIRRKALIVPNRSGGDQFDDAMTVGRGRILDAQGRA